MFSEVWTPFMLKKSESVVVIAILLKGCVGAVGTDSCRGCSGVSFEMVFKII